MSDRSKRSLGAAERVRQIAVDEAKRVLSDAIYVSNAARRKVGGLEGLAAAAQAHALSLLQSAGVLDLEGMRAGQRYRSWQWAELASARQVLAHELQAEAEARAALASSLRARDAVRHLQARRRLQAQRLETRRAQNALDDLGAIRAMASRKANIFPPGDHNVR